MNTKELTMHVRDLCSMNIIFVLTLFIEPVFYCLLTESNVASSVF